MCDKIRRWALDLSRSIETTSRKMIESCKTVGFTLLSDKGYKCNETDGHGLVKCEDAINYNMNCKVKELHNKLQSKYRH